ncbi:MAG: transposase [Burkholderiales bacterium]|nr:transposase [Burkholderiales bacterium]
MTRPLRIEFPGAIYHVTSRGNARAAIFGGDEDRELFLETLTQVVERFNWLCHSYCLMDNHYHLMIETPDGNLTVGMRQLNGVYTQRFNRRHRRVGHVFQGRFKAILVDRDSYLLELCRYVVLNPVRAGIVKRARDYRWSSYRAMAEEVEAPALLTCDWVLSQFGQSKSASSRKYREFVRDGVQGESPWEKLTGQILLGSERFVAKIKPVLASKANLKEITRVQRFANRPALATALAQGKLYSKVQRDRAIKVAHLKHGYTLSEIGSHLGLHYTTVSKVINQAR